MLVCWICYVTVPFEQLRSWWDAASILLHVLGDFYTTLGWLDIRKWVLEYNHPSKQLKGICMEELFDFFPWQAQTLYAIMHQSFVSPAPLGPGNSGAFNF